jgi:hypothetical protein
VINPPVLATHSTPQPPADGELTVNLRMDLSSECLKRLCDGLAAAVKPNGGYRDSYYFAADTHSTLRYDAIAEAWFICIRCNFKNYCGELRKFCEWIDPYVSANEGEFLGFSRYEESELPDLIFKQGNPPPPGRKLSAPVGPPEQPLAARSLRSVKARAREVVM